MPFIIKKLSRRVTLFAAVLLCTLCFLAFINRLILLDYGELVNRPTKIMFLILLGGLRLKLTLDCSKII